MKNKVLLFLAISLVIGLFAVNKYENYQTTIAVEHILNRRIEIMNEYLYGEKDMSELENRLEKIESGDLLKNDLGVLQKVRDNPTDYELAKSVKVKKIFKTKSKDKDDKLKLAAYLNWQMEGYDGEYNLIKKYSIDCVQTNNKLYLTKLRYIEEEN